ncbi:hypothetical protein QR680_018311 [Steinernema hermaphroditum]|uniref:EndoU domain-containing protein n=1 Tax=Steinernema hermaphroditum TaxID=289476 RepID=A0AA39LQM8_9BILA|nr:hypothetical protein QR680_018311 [Steinernema hermaphroditum]
MKYAVALLGALLCVAAVQGRYTRLISDADVNSALTNLADADTNAAQDGDLDVDYQNMASKKHPDHDNAPNPLFRSVSSDLLAKSTYVAFSTLVQQFTNPDVNVPDSVSDAAIDAYFNVISQTPVWSYTHSYLQKAGLSPEDATAFRKQLKDLWFTPYTLDGASGNGASGFKSVFAGEINGKNVYALNNWVRYFHLEQSGEVNYHGWFTRQKVIPLFYTGLSLQNRVFLWLLL